MSPKLVVGLSFGIGGIAMGSYSIFSYVSREENVITEEIIITDIDKITNTPNSITCNKPIKKVTLSSDESVMYYICDTITTTTTYKEDYPLVAWSVLQTQSVFKQIVANPASTQNLTKWTYLQNGQLPNIDIYWYIENDKTSKDIFYISKSSNNNQTTDITVTDMVKEIEQLRSYQSIEIKDQNSTKKEEKISCVTPKTATIQNIEYYICTSITDETTTEESSDIPQTPKQTTSFINDTSFKYRKGQKYEITKWYKRNDTTKSPYFYWFKPIDSKTKEIVFLAQTSTTQMPDADAKKWILDIKQFIKERKA